MTGAQCRLGRLAGDERIETCASLFPPAFAVFARGEVAAGRFASEEDAVVRALEAYLDGIVDLRSAVEEGFASFDRGEGVDGPSFMRDLIRETGGHSEG